MAARFPAFCPSCGLIFDSGPAEGENQVWLTLSAVRETCPRCLRKAERLDPSVDAVERTIHALATSGLTQDRLTSLHRILMYWNGGVDFVEAVPFEAVGTEETVIKLGETAPPLAPLLEDLRPVMGQAILHFLRMVVVLLLPLSSERPDEELAMLHPLGIRRRNGQPVSEREIRRAVEWAVEQAKVQVLP